MSIKHKDKDFIPLFPLPLVIGPGESVSLHIFEPRYKQMMKDIRAAVAPKHVLPFGLSLYREKPGKIADIGCTIRIDQVVKSHEDGKMDIIGHGDLRYQLEEVDRELPYARARVSYIVDSEPETDLAMLAEATRAVERLRKEVMDHKELPEHRKDYPSSFQLAHDAGLDNEAKYQLLSLRSEKERLRLVRDQSRRALQTLKKARAIRDRVQRNGHFEDFPSVEF